jgi:hypothetical protein
MNTIGIQRSYCGYTDQGNLKKMIQLYRVIKEGQLLHQGKWLTRGQIQQKFSHLMGELNVMDTISF